MMKNDGSVESGFRLSRLGRSRPLPALHVSHPLAQRAVQTQPQPAPLLQMVQTQQARTQPERRSGLALLRAEVDMSAGSLWDPGKAAMEAMAHEAGAQALESAASTSFGLSLRCDKQQTEHIAYYIATHTASQRLAAPVRNGAQHGTQHMDCKSMKHPGSNALGVPVVAYLCLAILADSWAQPFM
ncbi:hypothetical protein QJQ45_006395 [Haematococcus lacustris]|nr:hypothetical protein QJQ45_006395 [Haematococcus lacustris]